MFGYVTPLEGELKVKEHRLYKAVYCGLCRAMGKRVCTESRLTLSYDMVFLALVRFLLDEEPLTLEQIRCCTSLHKKRTVIARNHVLDYCGAAGAVLTCHNIADDVRDKKGFRRIAARLLLISAKRMRKKADLPILDGEIGALLTRLDGEENSADASPDSCASVFGELLGHVFAYGYEGEKRLIAYEIGFHTGKWIYLLDAADDFERDKKHLTDTSFIAGPPPFCNGYYVTQHEYFQGFLPVINYIPKFNSQQSKKAVVHKTVTATVDCSAAAVLAFFSVI